MKKLVLAIVSFSILFVIGCQEGSITDPVQNVSQNKLLKADDPSFYQGTITLDDMLTDPYPVMNSYYLINGAIEYEQIVQLINPASPSDLTYTLNLSLFINADFTYLCTVCDPENNENSVGSISLETNDIIQLTDNGTYILNKTFPLEGRDDEMVLKCRFIVTETNLQLEEIFLVLQGADIQHEHDLKS